MAKPTLALIPSAQGSKFYSVLPSNGVGDFQFSRSGSATRINKDGLIETVSNGVSRLNYPMIDGVVKGCPHHILEPQRTNLITYSEDFSQWVSTGGGVTSNQTISPDGSLNADKLFAQTNNGQHRLDFTSSNVAGATTFSFFIKSAEYNSVWARIGLSTSYFDLENAVSHNSTDNTSSVEYYGNGWYRCILTKEVSSANEVCRINITQYYKDSSGWTGDGVSGVYIWGAQFEQGSYPTSYIPNYGTAAGVTRSAEAASGSGDAATFNDSEGVLMAEISALANDGTFRVISINGTATNVNTNRIQIYFRDTADIITFGMESENSSQFFLQFPLDVKSNNKLALKYSASSCSFWINGIKVGEETNKIMPTDLIRLDFVRQDGNDEFFYGNTKQIQYFDTVLTDNELETLTSWTSFTDLANGQQYSIK